MISDIDVRKPEVQDVRGIFACLSTYNVHPLTSNCVIGDPNFSDSSILTLRNEICHIDFSDKCWVAVNNDDVLGFCCWDWLGKSSLEAKTVLIATSLEVRGLGVGKLLQQRRQDDMIENGATGVHTWSDDPKAIGWYTSRFGYEPVGKEPIRHCLHHFHYSGKHSVWALHRGFVERDELVHLHLKLPALSEARAIA